MSATGNTSLVISKPLLIQAESLAQQLNVSQSQLFELALEYFIKSRQAQPLQTGEGRAIIKQGDIYWVSSVDASGPEPGIMHPHVVVQDDVFNRSRIHTVVVCALTSNIGRASIPGNVLLEAGEADLPRQSVVEVSKVSTVDKTQLGEYIGSLTEQRISQLLAGMRFLQQSFFARDQA